MPGTVERLAHRWNAADDAGGGFIVDYADCLDRVIAILHELALDRLCIGAMAPVARYEIDGKPEPRRQLLPQRRELAGLRHQYAITGRQRIDQCGFPGARAGSRIYNDRALGAEYQFDAVHDFATQLREIRAAVVDRGPVHRAQHTVGDIGRAGDLQEMPSAAQGR